MISKDFLEVKKILIDILINEDYKVGKFEINVSAVHNNAEFKFIETVKDGDTDITKVRKIN